MEFIEKIEDTTPTICLNMIVKNEEHIIEKTLQMLISKIKFSYWVICDTGSTDNTKQIINDFFSRHCIPGELIESTWVNFAHNRTIALQMAFLKTQLLLVFDADDEIHGHLNMPAVFDPSIDGYTLFFGEQEGVVSYKRILLVNNHVQWEYKSVVHEYIQCLKPDAKIVDLTGNYYLISGRSGSRNQDPKKYLNDALLLEDAWQTAVKENDPLYIRYAFYCANSYKDYGDWTNAIKWYKITLGQNNWVQEKYMSCINIFKCYRELKEIEPGLYYLVESIKYDNERIEGIFYLVEYYCMHNMFNIAYNYYLLVKPYYETVYINLEYIDKLFSENELYSFLLPYYIIIVADKVKNKTVDYLKTIKNMFKIIFKKKYRITNLLYLGNVLYNFSIFVSFFAEQNDNIIEDFKEYVVFFKKLGYDFTNPKYKFLETFKKYGLDFDNNPKYSVNECKSCKNILIYTGYMNFKWNYSYSLNNSLGGSESAAINLALSFPKEYNIYIAGNVEEETVGNISFINDENINSLVSSMPFYCTIISRYISFFENYSICSYKHIIWAHDVRLFNYGTNLSVNDILVKWINKIDYCVCQTEWHQNLFHNLYPVLRDKLTNINNGIKLEKFVFEPFKILNRFIYTSCSERGLDKLLDLWPHISNELPNSELLICSYNDFPRNDYEIKLQEKINREKNIAHLGKLDKNKLYELMSSAEYWLYPTDFSETSCITAMEMLASEVICVYYPVAGLNNTLGYYGIPVKEGEEISTIMGLTNKRKTELRRKGKEYALTCSWDNRFVSWNKLLMDKTNEPKEPNETKEKQKLLFFHDKRFTINALIDYFDSLKEIYEVSYTSNENELTNINNTLVLFVVYLLDITVIDRIISKNVNNSYAFFNSEPLNTKMFYENCKYMMQHYPSIKVFYDYSKTNELYLRKLGKKENNIKILEYIPYESETTFLRNLLVTVEKEYDFGIIEFNKPIEKLCWRRRNCILTLRNNGFKVLIVSGWKDERDKQLAKCKCILNIHGQNVDYEWPTEEHVTQVFEHIRCDRLLAAGFQILSEPCVSLDPNFVKKYPNLKFMNYKDILQLQPAINIHRMHDIIDNRRTDKNTTHSYLDLYQKLLEPKRLSATNVLEVGICAGGSIKLWHDYFTNATVYGLDIMHRKDVWPEILDKDRIKLYLETDAYDDTFFNKEFLDKNIKLDIIIDDGPHTLASMIKFVELYSQLLNDNGILIIEDIQDYNWIQVITNAVPKHLKEFIKIFDLRTNKGRYDDILFIIDLTNIIQF
jgi:Glycosyl transferase family 2